MIHAIPRWFTYTLRDTFCDDSDGSDLGVLHQLHRGAVDTSRGGEVDDNINIGVLSNGLSRLLVNR